MENAKSTVKFIIEVYTAVLASVSCILLHEIIFQMSRSVFFLDSCSLHLEGELIGAQFESCMFLRNNKNLFINDTASLSRNSTAP